MKCSVFHLVAVKCFNSTNFFAEFSEGILNFRVLKMCTIILVGIIVRGTNFGVEKTDMEFSKRLFSRVNGVFAFRCFQFYFKLCKLLVVIANHQCLPANKDEIENEVSFKPSDEEFMLFINNFLWKPEKIVQSKNSIPFYCLLSHYLLYEERNSKKL